MTADNSNNKTKKIDEKQLKELQQAFALFDKDGSGSIDKYELKACLRVMGHHTDPVELDKLMQNMDRDGNGAPF
jgi:Ca2+-binding EF-hand superfamily protein